MVRWKKLSAITAGIVLGVIFLMWAGEFGETVFRQQKECNPLRPSTCEP